MSARVRVALLGPLASLAALAAVPAAASAAEGCQYVRNSVTIPVPDREVPATSAVSRIQLVDTGEIGDVEIELNVPHSRTEDLDISLRHDGTTVGLTSDNGGTGDDYTATRFDDEAPLSITQVNAPFTGTFRPESPLSVFDDRPIAGMWTLIVSDDGIGEVGSLVSWTIHWTSSDLCSDLRLPRCQEAGQFLDRPIPQAPATTNSALRVAKGPGNLPVTDVDVSLRIAHPNTGELNVFTRGVGSTDAQVALSTGNGTGANFADTIFDQAAGTAITAGASPFAGRFRPEADLGIFTTLGNGSGPTQSFTLNAGDTVDNAADGTVQRFSVLVRDAGCVDPDGDQSFSTYDNCPDVPNEQEDYEADGRGDACDPDDDNDARGDGEDPCPRSEPPGGEDLDLDGCTDEEDADDDADGFPDASDPCPTGQPGTVDTDGDGCADRVDADDDGDGVPDADDRCPIGAVGPGVDADGDGCADAEDGDDDGDGRPDADDPCPGDLLNACIGTPGPGPGTGPIATGAADADGDAVPDLRDNCPLAPNPDQRDTDRDRQGDACDDDDDGDAVRDAADRCRAVKGARPSGCRTVRVRLTATVRRTGVTGRATAATRRCATALTVTIHRDRARGRDPRVGRAIRTDATGRFRLRRTLPPGRYYAKASARVLRDVAACAAVTSARGRVRT